MATYSGRNAHVKLASNEIQELGSWEITLESDQIDTSKFGTGWKSFDIGMIGWTATVEGSYDPSDSTGQDVLKDSLLNRSLISNIRFYVDDTSYWTPDLTTDSDAGCYVTSFNARHDKADVARVTYNIAGVGPLTLE